MLLLLSPESDIHAPLQENTMLLLPFPDSSDLVWPRWSACACVSVLIAGFHPREGEGGREGGTEGGTEGGREVGREGREKWDIMLASLHSLIQQSRNRLRYSQVGRGVSLPLIIIPFYIISIFSCY